jgi:MoaA/NifB/PqqE/SkfB family radical SAM enzyme
MGSERVERLLKRIPQYTRMGRHLRAVIRHGTPRKWANLVRVEAEMRLRRIEVTGRPYILFLDPCNLCNLRCPLCATGMGKLGRPQGMMTLDCFRRWLEPHVPYLFEVNCHNWGESLINEAVFEMIAHAQAMNVGTNMSSNLVIAQDHHLDGLIEAGLEHLTVSVDGADQQSYERYRVRGKFDRVVENMARLVEKRRRKGRGPTIEWQYIVMRHNEDRVEEAERIAARIGIDRIRFIPVGLPFEVRNRRALAEEWFPRRFSGRDRGREVPQTFGQADRPAPCYYLYRSMVINTDGGVSPCCIVYDEKRDFDHMDRHPVIDVAAIYNNEKFRSARALYTAREWEGRARTVCDHCDIFARHPSKLPAAMAARRAARARAAHDDARRPAHAHGKPD